MLTGQKLYKKAKTLIPGGTQLLSKRPELFLPELWPAYYSKAKGCEIWGLDGNHYYDFITMGIGTCILGYGDDDVNTAVKRVIDKGSMSSLNPPEEVELAELLIELHPWAEMVRFARSGGEAMTVALRIARAKSKKDKVLFCGYHGWHDWYLSANLSEDSQLDGHLLPGLEPNGVPRSLRETAIPFNYNNTEELKEIYSKNKNEIGVIILETVRNEEPMPEFVQQIQEIAANGVVFIVDEITSGWRINLGGAHLVYGIKPDLAVFAKGMSNGYPMGAIIGKKDVMEAAQTSFISSTYWTERIGPAAAIASIRKMKEKNVQARLIETGSIIQKIWKDIAQHYNIDINITGIKPLGHFAFEQESLVLKTLFTQKMLKRGFLASTVFYASYAHSDEAIELYENAVREVFAELKIAIDSGSPRDFLEGPVCHAGFKRLN